MSKLTLSFQPRKYWKSFSVATRGAWVTASLTASSLIALSGCVLDNTSMKNPEKILTPNMNMVLTINSDYKTGSYSAFGIDSTFILKDLAPIYSDAVVRYLGGDDIFILNRMGRDNLQMVNRYNLKTVQQVAFPALSNPQDIALKDSLIYVAFFGTAKIGIYRQSDGSAQGEIDLTNYADTADHLPETTKLQFIGNSLYALLANLNTKPANWVPLQAKLVKIDVVAKVVTNSINLPFGNPASLSHDPVSNKLYIPCRGILLDANYLAVLDGGIVGVDLSKFALAETLATEVNLGGSLNSALYNQGHLLMDLSDSGAVPGESLISITISTGKAMVWGKLGAYEFGGMDIDTASNSLFVGDSKQGLRIFNLATGKENANSKQSLSSLPIRDLAVIR
jgi:hypothetical protein